MADVQRTFPRSGSSLPRMPAGLPRAQGRSTSGVIMEGRVTALEVTAEFMRRDLDEIKADNKHILREIGSLKLSLVERFAELPTKRDLSSWTWQFIAAGVAGAALIVGGVIGGLDWIRPDPQPPAPVVIQLPAQPSLEPPAL